MTGASLPHAEPRFLTINWASPVTPVRLSVNGRDYLTAPAVLIVAGVLNQAYIPGEALDPQAWHGIPVVCNHPTTSEGVPISARDPEVLAQCGMGTLYHARLGTGRRQREVVTTLQAELWLDIAQVRMLGGDAERAMDRIEAQELVELSTGFYAEGLPQSGTAYGEPYTEIFTTLWPDHVALLPQSVGACSVADGCGAPRLNTARRLEAQEETAMTIPVPTEDPPRGWRGFLQVLRTWLDGEHRPESGEPAAVPPVVDEAHGPDDLVLEQTDVDVREAIYSALAQEMGSDWTPIFIDSLDIPNQAFVYRQGERLYQRRWTVEADGVLRLDAMAQDVQRQTTFLPLPGAAADVEAPEASPMMTDMARCAQCQEALTTTSEGHHCLQCAQQDPLTRERIPMTTTPLPVSPVAIKARVNNLILNKQYGWGERDRSMLEAMPEATLIRLESQPVIIPPVEAPVPAAPQTAVEAIAGMPEHLRDMFMQMHADYQGRRQAALGMLLANKACPFDQDQLQGMALDTLERLVAMGAGVEYSGRGLPAVRKAPEVLEQPPEPPNVLDRVLQRQRELGLR